MADININGFAEELNEKADLAYVDNVDTSAVHKTGNETISDIKTFSKALECVNGLNLKNTGITKGTTPAATQYWGIRANDKTSPGSSWENTRLGVLEWYLNSSNVTGLTLQAYKNESDSTAAASISLQYHGNESKPKILINGKEMVAFVTETYRSGTEWYRKYSDGWVEQGGFLSNTSSAAHTVTLPIAMKDTNYSLMVTLKANTVAGSGGSWANGTVVSTTQITIIQDYVTTWVGQGSYWVVAGYAA